MAGALTCAHATGRVLRSSRGGPYPSQSCGSSAQSWFRPPCFHVFASEVAACWRCYLPRTVRQRGMARSVLSAWWHDWRRYSAKGRVLPGGAPIGIFQRASSVYTLVPLSLPQPATARRRPVVKHRAAYRALERWRRHSAPRGGGETRGAPSTPPSGPQRDAPAASETATATRGRPHEDGGGKPGARLSVADQVTDGTQRSGRDRPREAVLAPAATAVCFDPGRR